MKKQRFWILTIAVLLGVAFLGYYGYVSTRQARLLKQARGYLARSNPKTALACLRRALGYNPKDVEACRLMAELVERGSSPAATLWRSRVVELTPKSTPDRIALAQTAMMFGDYLSRRHPVRHQLDDMRNGNAQSTESGAATKHVRIMCDAVEHGAQKHDSAA